MTPAERHAAVLAGLGELELLAAGAGPSPWRWDHPAQWGPRLLAADGDILLSAYGPDGAGVAVIEFDQAAIVALCNAAAGTLAGRRRILERHAPASLPGIDEPWCGCCRPTQARWPCDTYVDAAADLLPADPA